MPHTIIDLVCANPACGKAFSKRQKDIGTKVRMGQTKFYCSAACAQRASHARMAGSFAFTPASLAAVPTKNGRFR